MFRVKFFFNFEGKIGLYSVESSNCTLTVIMNTKEAFFSFSASQNHFLDSQVYFFDE